MLHAASQLYQNYFPACVFLCHTTVPFSSFRNKYMYDDE